MQDWNFVQFDIIHIKLFLWILRGEFDINVQNYVEMNVVYKEWESLHLNVIGKVMKVHILCENWNAYYSKHVADVM